MEGEAGAAKAEDQWSYMSQSYISVLNDNEQMMNEFNRFGRIGWELVTVTDEPDGVRVAFFKRRKPPEAVQMGEDGWKY